MKFLKYLLILIVLLVLIFFGKGLLTPEISYQSQISVNKSIEEAWAVMSDESNLPEWIDGFQKTELVSGTHNTVGAVSNVYVEENGQEMVMQETINAIKAPDHLNMTFTMDFMDMDYDMALSNDNGKTLIVTKSKTTGNGLIAKSMISFMTSAMKKQEDANLSNLKRLIEENTKNYFPEPEVQLDPAMESEVEVGTEG